MAGTGNRTVVLRPKSASTGTKDVQLFNGSWTNSNQTYNLDCIFLKKKQICSTTPNLDVRLRQENVVCSTQPNLDVKFSKTTSKNIPNFDAIFKKKNVLCSTTPNLDVWFAKRITCSTTPNLDVYFRNENATVTDNLDVYLKKYGITKTDNLDSILKKLGLTKTDNLNALLKKLGILKTYNLTGILRNKGVKLTDSLDTIFGRAKFYNLNVLFEKLGLTNTSHISSLFRTSTTQSVSAFEGLLPLYCIPVTLTNSSSNVLSSGTSVQVIVDSNTNSSLYASNLQNANWQDFYGNILTSWLESGETNTSTSTVYWIILPSSIAASGGTLTIYQMVYSTITSVFDGINTGAEPNWSGGSYGQYDNGTILFSTFYEGFHGNSLNSNVWDVCTNGGATNAIVSDGLLLAGESGSCSATGIYTKSQFSQSNIILEFCGFFCNNIASGGSVCFGIGFAGPTNWTNSGCSTQVSSIFTNVVLSENSTYSIALGNSLIGTDYTVATIGVYGLTINSDGSSVTSNFNYASPYTISGKTSALNPSPIGLFVQVSCGITQIYWIRIRPSTVTMPSASFSSAISTASQLWANGQWRENSLDSNLKNGPNIYSLDSWFYQTGVNERFLSYRFIEPTTQWAFQDYYVPITYYYNTMKYLHNGSWTEPSNDSALGATGNNVYIGDLFPCQWGYFLFHVRQKSVVSIAISYYYGTAILINCLYGTTGIPTIDNYNYTTTGSVSSGIITLTAGKYVEFYTTSTAPQIGVTNMGFANQAPYDTGSQVGLTYSLQPSIANGNCSSTPVLIGSGVGVSFPQTIYFAGNNTTNWGATALVMTTEAQTLVNSIANAMWSCLNILGIKRDWFFGPRGYDTAVTLFQCNTEINSFYFDDGCYGYANPTYGGCCSPYLSIFGYNVGSDSWFFGNECVVLGLYGSPSGPVMALQNNWITYKLDMTNKIFDRTLAFWVSPYSKTNTAGHESGNSYGFAVCSYSTPSQMPYSTLYGWVNGGSSWGSLATGNWAYESDVSGFYATYTSTPISNIYCEGYQEVGIRGDKATFTPQWACAVTGSEDIFCIGWAEIDRAYGTLSIGVKYGQKNRLIVSEGASIQVNPPPVQVTTDTSIIDNELTTYIGPPHEYSVSTLYQKTVTETDLLSLILKKYGVKLTDTLDVFFHTFPKENLDVLFEKLGITKTEQLSSLFKKLGITEAYNVSFLMSKLGIKKTDTLDVILLKLGVTKTDNLTTLLKKMGITETYNINLILEKVGIKLTDSISVYLKKLGVTKTENLDAILKKLGLTKNDSMDVLFKQIQYKTYDIDLLLKKLKATKTEPLDVVLGHLGIIKTDNIDALLAKLKIKENYTLSMLFEKCGIKETDTLDVVLKNTVAKNILLTSLFVKKGIKVTDSLDVILKGYNITIPTTVIFEMLKVKKTDHLDVVLAKLHLPRYWILDVLFHVPQNQVHYNLGTLLELRNISIEESFSTLFEKLGIPLPASLDTVFELILAPVIIPLTGGGSGSQEQLEGMIKGPTVLPEWEIDITIHPIVEIDCALGIDIFGEEAEVVSIESSLAIPIKTNEENVIGIMEKSKERIESKILKFGVLESPLSIVIEKIGEFSIEARVRSKEDQETKKKLQKFLEYIGEV